MRKKQVVFNSFYCLKCGKEVYTLPRARSLQHSSGHRKRLYCPHCKVEVNCYECANDQDAYEFKEAFTQGAFVEEAAESIAFCEGDKV